MIITIILKYIGSNLIQIFILLVERACLSVFMGLCMYTERLHRQDYIARGKKIQIQGHLCIGSSIKV